MKADPRINNTWFNENSLTEYFTDYKKNLATALESLNVAELEKAHQLMRDVVKRSGTFFIAGNGGSAGIADHLCCDWTKGTFVEGKIRLKTHSLGANVPLLTAVANDFGYDEVFARQIKMLAHPTDALLVISSSGNSPNIVKAIEQAQQMGLKTIALTGFSGGLSREKADIKLHVNFANYAIVEDCHQAIMQALAQYFFVAEKNGSLT
jgi:D-sedoheptulose 7-phosphate isomerase